VKIFRHASIGLIHLTSSSLSIDGMAESRIVVYTPVAEEDRLQIERLRAMSDPVIGCSVHGRRVSEILAERAAAKAARLAAETERATADSDQAATTA
jgi:hypothetical protein